MTVSEMAGRFVATNTRHPISTTSGLKSVNARRIMVKMLLRLLPAALFSCRFNSLSSRAQRAVDKIVIDERNVIAVEGINTHLTHTDIVCALWGAGHLFGIDKLLRRQGFRRYNSEWITAVDLKQISRSKHREDTSQLDASILSA